MTLSTPNPWKIILEEVKHQGKINRRTFDDYLGPTRLIGNGGGTLQVEIPSEEFRGKIENDLSKHIDRAIKARGLPYTEVHYIPYEPSGDTPTPAPTTARPRDAAPWPDPAPLGDNLPAVEGFNAKLLPESLRPWVEDISERMQAPLDFGGASAAVATAGSVNRRAMIHPLARDSSWRETPNIWGGIIGPPGVMKSPLMARIMRPLERMEGSWHDTFNSELESYESAKELHELDVSAWKEEYKRSKKKKGSMPQAKPKLLESAPVRKRLIVNDATFETLHTLMAENGNGLLLLRDELTGWLATLDRQGREGERAFALECWNGNRPFTIDRIGRGTVDVPACCLSLFGCIQPARLRSYLVDALKDGPSNDGLIQRFQVLVWPDIPKGWKLVDRQPNKKFASQAAEVFSRLAKLDSKSPVRLNFAADAQELFNEWLTKLELRIRSGTLHPAMAAHLSKYRKLMPALGLLFELADNPTAPAVSLNHARQAMGWCQYLESHAARMYSCVTTPEVRAARELATHIQRGDLADCFSARDVYLKGWTGLGDPTEAHRALEILIDSGWVKRISPEPSAAGGRPADRFEKNPKIPRT